MRAHASSRSAEEDVAPKYGSRARDRPPRIADRRHIAADLLRGFPRTVRIRETVFLLPEELGEDLGEKLARETADRRNEGAIDGELVDELVADGAQSRDLCFDALDLDIEEPRTLVDGLALEG